MNKYGSFLFQSSSAHSLQYHKRGITKLVAPNLNFKDIIIHENDLLKCIGRIITLARTDACGNGSSPIRAVDLVLFTLIF